MSEEKEVKNYSDVKPKAEDLYPDCEKVDMTTVLDKEIVINDFKGLPSTMTIGKEFVFISAVMAEKKIRFSCGEIVLKQLNEIKDSLPIKTTITKPEGKKYYKMN